MTPITVAMEVSQEGTVLKEAFTMVHDSLETAKRWETKLNTAFKNGSYKTAWSSKRAKKADTVISRGNRLVFKSFIF